MLGSGVKFKGCGLLEEMVIGTWPFSVSLLLPGQHDIMLCHRLQNIKPNYHGWRSINL